MIVVNRKEDRLTGAINGTPYNVPFEQEKFDSLKLLSKRLEQSDSKDAYKSIIDDATKLVEVDFKEEVAAANGYLKYRKNTGHYYLVINKGKKNETISSIPMPKQLVDMILESYEDGNDFMPLILAWSNFIARPHHRNPEMVEYFGEFIAREFVDEEKVNKLIEEDGLTEEAAELLSTFQDIAVTDAGLFVTYKVVDRVTEKWIIKTDEDGNEEKVKVPMFKQTKTVDEVTGEVTVEEENPEYAEELTFTPAIWKNGHKFFCGDKLSYCYKVGKEAVLPEEAPRNRDNSFGGGGLSMAA